MAGSFNVTFTMDGSTRAEPPAGVPALRSLDLFPTRIWQASLGPLVPRLPAWVKEVLAMLALFPCWMEHYVEPHESDEPRITLAFNANEPP